LQDEVAQAAGHMKSIFSGKIPSKSHFAREARSGKRERHRHLRVPEKPSFADQATKSSLIVRKNKH
jgi:hypothetical protein